MAPIRRYLRITRYSVLEVRIYLDNPTLTSSWLLHPRTPVLPRVIEAVRPLVLPKLKEENARDRSKAKGKKKSVKDVVVEDDFEVSIFLTETSTRHSLLTKQRHFRESGMASLRSNSNRLTGAGATSEEIIQVEDGSADTAIPFVPREDSDEYMVSLGDIPLAEGSGEENASETALPRPKRGSRGESDEEDNSDGLFVSDEDEGPSLKRVKGAVVVNKDKEDDKKKMAMDTSYDGFSIYGRVLCLVVKKKDSGKAKAAMSAGRAMMEEWITSTQMPPIDEDVP